MNFKFSILNLKSNKNKLILIIKILKNSLKIKNYKLKIVCVAFAFCFLTSQSAFAQSKNTISVSPQLIQLDLSTDKPEAEYTYTNNTNQTIELTLTMQDVRELEDRGIPEILSPNDSKNYLFGLSSWATFSNRNLVISPGEIKTVTVFIDKTRLSQGGHYASVLAEIAQKEEKKTVKLRAIISSLLFVRAGSQFDKEDGEITELKPLRDGFSEPKSFTFRLKSSGNVDVTPYGLLYVYDPFKKLIAKAVVNEDSLITLPESERKYTVKLPQETKFLLPGNYTARLDVHFGKKRIDIRKETSFWVLSNLFIYSATGILIVIGIAIGFAIKLRRKK